MEQKRSPGTVALAAFMDVLDSHTLADLVARPDSLLYLLSPLERPCKLPVESAAH